MGIDRIRLFENSDLLCCGVYAESTHRQLLSQFLCGAIEMRNVNE